EQNHPVSRLLTALYTPVVRFVVRHRWLVIGGTVLAMVLTVPVAQRLGREFMPPLNEGVILYMPSAPPGMSVTQAAEVIASMDAALAAFPEVVSVFGKM